MRNVIVALTLILIFSSFSAAQDTLWTRHYGFPSSAELGLCGNVTSDGGYIAGGVSYHFTGLNGEFWLARTDSNGDTIWTRNYGGDRWQEAHYVTETSDGGFAVCGGTSIAVGDDDMYIVKTDANGDTMWTFRYGYPGVDDDGQAIIQTSDNGYLAVGHVYYSGTFQLSMVKLDAAGDSLWTKKYGGAYSDYGYGVVETADQGFALTGTYSTSSSSDLWLLRTDSNGDTLWTRRFDFHGGLDRGDGIVLAPNGGFAIGGRTWAGSQPQMLVLRTDSLGNTLWSREFGGAADEFAESIDIMPDGGFVVGGGAGPYPFDYYIARVSAGGDSLWAARYDGPAGGESDDCYEVRVDPSGYIMAFGYADISPTAYDPEYWVLKIQDNAAVQQGFLTGQIFDENTTDPLDAVNIGIFDQSDSLVESGISGGDGTFIFGLNPGTYYASFSRTDYEDTTLTGLEITASETTSVTLIMISSLLKYLPGDVAMRNGGWPPNRIGGDVTYLVGYFRGINEPCLLGDPPFYCAADVNGDCAVIGSDVTRMVSYFRGLTTLTYCPDYPTAWPYPEFLPDDPPLDWPGCL